MDDSDTAIILFNENYNELKEHYSMFIEDVKQFAKEQLDALLT
jgi:archaellum component FlaC